MLKVVVFDSGWGGEMIADYIEEELPIVDVIRVIDWRNAPYSLRSEKDVCMMTELALRHYIGRVDVIILATSVVSYIAYDYLRNKYPEQKFVCCGLELVEQVKDSEPKCTMVLATNAVKNSKTYCDMKEKMKSYLMIEPECDDWVQKVDDGEMTLELLKESLKKESNEDMEQVDLICILCTHFIDIEDSLRDIFKWKARIYDSRKVIMHNLCVALGLRGGDGTRKK